MRHGRVIGKVVFLLLITASTASAQTGWGIGFRGKDLYFSDLDRGRVLKLDPQGSLHVLIEDVHCHNLAPGYDSDVYGEAVGTGRGGTGDVVGIWLISPQDEVQHIMPLRRRPEAGVWIARDGLGNSYSWHREGESISQIVRRDTNGTVSVLAGGEWGFQDGRGSVARFAAVGAIAATPDGVLFVTDSSHLRKISPQGEVETVATNFVSERTGGLPGDFGLFNHSVGLAISPAGDVYVVDAYNLRVLRWSSSRGTAVVWDASNWLSRLTDGGLAWHPRGVALDGESVHILESLTLPEFMADLAGTPRIRKVSDAGESQVVRAVASWPMRLVTISIALVLVILSGRLMLVLRSRKRRLKSGWAD